MRLRAVALMVPDWDAGIAFYVDGLGFDLVEHRREARKRWVTVRPGPEGTLLVLAVGSDEPPKRVAFFLETEDFDRDASRIREAGGRFEEEPRTQDYGRVAVWRDPFGNRWDLIQPA